MREGGEGRRWCGEQPHGRTRTDTDRHGRLERSESRGQEGIEGGHWGEKGAEVVRGTAVWREQSAEVGGQEKPEQPNSLLTQRARTKRKRRKRFFGGGGRKRGL